ncbi:MAG: hypothetical protein Salg2KO_00790 [Salibacteraceae bacterium]
MGILDTLKSMVGNKEQVDYKELMQQGAQIVDVRSRGEYAGGHVAGSMNIPLPELEKGLSKIKKEKPVITCCASGMRSQTAKHMLESRGYKNVHNGGGWASLNGRV